MHYSPVFVESWSCPLSAVSVLPSSLKSLLCPQTNKLWEARNTEFFISKLPNFGFLKNSHIFVLVVAIHCVEEIRPAAYGKKDEIRALKIQLVKTEKSLWSAANDSLYWSGWLLNVIKTVILKVGKCVVETCLGWSLFPKQWDFADNSLILKRLTNK